MSGLYLTIDDGPSEKFCALIDFLKERQIPAVFFNRGDMMEKRQDDVIYGIKNGYIMGNHGWSHRRASQISYQEVCGEISRTDDILEDLYNQAGTPRPGKYFRFPYMDRGMESFFVEPDSLNEEYHKAHNELLETGLGRSPAKLKYVSEQDINKKRQLQKFLIDQNYEALPVQGITIPWYAQTKMAQTIDSLCSFSTCDWTLSEKHKGRRGFKNTEDLKSYIDNNTWLGNKNSNHVILAHDQADLYEITTALIDHFLKRDFDFLGL